MIDMPDSIEMADSKREIEQKESRPSRLRTGLLVVGSALLGGIAVALWNRRSLTDIRSQVSKKESEPPPASDDAIY
jgi:hypothetical protein